MTEAEHSSLAQGIEERLRRGFSTLQCSVRSHVDTHTSEPIAMLIFEVHATQPSIQIPYTLIENEVYDESGIESLAAHIGTMLSQRVRSARR
jgi:hypothetical protein